MNNEYLDNMDNEEYDEKVKELSDKDLVDEMLRQTNIYDIMVNHNTTRFNMCYNEVLNRFKTMSEGLDKINHILQQVEDKLDNISIEINTRSK